MFDWEIQSLKSNRKGAAPDEGSKEINETDSVINENAPLSKMITSYSNGDIEDIDYNDDDIDNDDEDK